MDYIIILPVAFVVVLGTSKKQCGFKNKVKGKINAIQPLIKPTIWSR